MFKSHWRHVFLFYKAVLSHPRSIGAICPSSKKLARTIARYAIKDSDQFVIELGAGTGVVTEALLDRGLRTDRLVVIEASGPMVTHLRANFPGILVIQGDAAQLSNLLSGRDLHPSIVVSSLPLRSLPRQTAKAITDQIAKLLPKGGKYIQFTYSYKKGEFGLPDHFKRAHCKQVWKNIPPARVDVYVVSDA